MAATQNETEKKKKSFQVKDEIIYKHFRAYAYAKRLFSQQTHKTQVHTHARTAEGLILIR